MIDYHSHLLPGVDDGAADVVEALSMARILSAAGFTEVHCTPHLIKGGYENPPAAVRKETATLQQLVQDAGIALRLVAGTEHYLDEFLPGYLPEAVTVSGSSAILVETPFRGEGNTISIMIGNLLQRGLKPLIAHPERCGAFAPAGRSGGFFAGILGRRKKPVLEDSLLWKLKARGCRYQGNLGSFAGVYGREIRERALFFLEEGMYSCLGSDAHRTEGLEDTLSRGIAAVEGAIGKEAAQSLLRGALGELA